MVNGQQSTDFVRFFLDAEGLGDLGIGILGFWDWGFEGLGIRCLSLSKAKVRHFDRLSDLAQSLLRAMSNELWAKLLITRSSQLVADS